MLDGSVRGPITRSVPEGVLVIDLIDRDRLDVRAAGSFTSAGRDQLEHRLDRMVACGIRDLRIDFADAVAMEPSAGQVFLEARERFGAIGGSLRFLNTSDEVAAALRRLT
jgi:anti-anti-sigma regulatory factor